MRVDALTDLGVLASLAGFGEQQEGVPLGEGGLHAREWETSLLLGTDPEFVHMERAGADYVGDPEEALGAVFDLGARWRSARAGSPDRADASAGVQILRCVPIP